jgi:hypothetical protein
MLLCLGLAGSFASGQYVELLADTDFVGMAEFAEMTDPQTGMASDNVTLRVRTDIIGLDMETGGDATDTGGIDGNDDGITDGRAWGNGNFNAQAEVLPQENLRLKVSFDADVHVNIAAYETRQPFISEIHYDNSGPDFNEAVEITGLLGDSVTGWGITLYDGGGNPYLSRIENRQMNLPHGCAGLFGTHVFDFGEIGSDIIENGHGAIAFWRTVGTDRELIQFLSYGGPPVAGTWGIAEGITSDVIPLEENSDTISFNSLQLSGTGDRYDQFFWSISPSSFGDCNSELTVSSTRFTAESTFSIDAVLQIALADSPQFFVERLRGATVFGLSEGSIAPSGDYQTQIGSGAALIENLSTGSSQSASDSAEFELIVVPVTLDFTGDRKLTIDDVDALVAEIEATTASLAFDLNNDSDVDRADLQLWLDFAGYSRGDADLDGKVDSHDFAIWNANRFTSHPVWIAGDFDMNGIVDGRDFEIWNRNKFTDSNSVPEPLSGTVSLLLLSMIVVRASTDRPQ